MIRLFLKRKKNKTIWPTSSSDMHGPVACQYHTQEISHKYNYWGAHKEYLESLIIQSVHPLLKIAADQAHQMHPRRQKILQISCPSLRILLSMLFFSSANTSLGFYFCPRLRLPVQFPTANTTIISKILFITFALLQRSSLFYKSPFRSNMAVSSIHRWTLQQCDNDIQEMLKK